MKTSRATSQDKIIYLPGGVSPTDFDCLDAKAFTELIASISARMVKASAENLDQEIVESLKMIFKHLEADRGGLLKVSEDQQTVRVSHAWYGGDIAQIPPELNVAELFPWYFGKLVAERNIMALAKCSALPQEAKIDLGNLQQHGVKSTLGIPLFIGTRVHHIIAIDTLKSEREWPIDIITNIKLLGEIFVGALQRREQDSLLSQYRDRMEVAAASAEAGLWELDRKTGQFWTTSQARNLFGYAADEQVTLDNFLEKVCTDDRAAVLDAVDRLSKDGDALFVEYRTSGPTGDRWMCSKGRLLTVDGNGSKKLMGVTLDITHRKQMEEDLRARLQEITQLRKQLEKENTFLRQEASLAKSQEGFLGDCAVVKDVLAQAEQVASTDSTVLIQGETGTGKELLAQAIHQKSTRAERTMVTVNCAALPEALVESELFGREKGAYTGALSRQAGRFELADGSTLFLDEISEIPLETQAKLLRVLQDGEFQRLGNPRNIKTNVRIIAASNRDLLAEVGKGRFREDLFYRLSIFPITIPPLRERTEDIPTLVWSFVGEFGARMGKRIRKVSKADMETMQSYSWPGNVRELRNIIEHSMIVSQGETLDLKRLNGAVQQTNALTKLVDVERQHIESILKTTRGRVKGKGGAAELLDMKPSTLYSRMHKLGISNIPPAP